MRKAPRCLLVQQSKRLRAGGVRLRDGSFISAGLVVNSAGSWSPAVDAGLEVKKRKGHLVITDRYPNFVRHQLVELGYLKSAHSLTAESVAFNIQPRKTGQLLIGSSRQFGVDDSHVDNSNRDAHARSRCRIPAGSREALVVAHVDGISCCDTGQTSANWSTRGTRATLSRYRPRRTRHHDLTRHRKTARRSNYESRERDSGHALFACADGTGAGACLRL